MTDNRTTELRKLLDERGVEHRTHYLHTSWCVGSKLYLAVDNLDGTLTVGNLTPEQAIAATLDDGEYEAKMDALLSRLTNGKFSKSRAYDLDFMESCVNEEFEELYAEELADAALGSGTLTAEQVRDAVMSADRWKKPMGNTGLTNTQLIIRDDGWQAIADELNAKRHVETCENLTPDDRPVVWTCSNCLYQAESYQFNYCPNCGRKVVDNADE